jgi:predicted RNA-binding protein YlqC (UPF0109 family)
MIELIKFLITKITGSEDFDIEESHDERGELFTVRAKPEIIGLIIGKAGKTIKNIRRIASIKATSENKFININVIERD